MTDLPRGVRNNNPGNIKRFGAQPWEGMAPAARQIDPEFLVFVDAEHGLRALALVLLHYQEKHNLRTLRTIIGRYAPASDDNAPMVYAQTVARSMRVGRDDILDLRKPATMAALINGIVKVECTDYGYPQALVLRGIALAFSADHVPDLDVPPVVAPEPAAAPAPEPPAEPAPAEALPAEKENPVTQTEHPSEGTVDGHQESAPEAA